MQFKVRYFDPARRGVSEIDAEAPSEADLRAEFTSRGMVVLSAARADNVRGSGAAGGSKNFSVAWWCRELRTLLQAGMTVVEALETLHLQAHRQGRQALHAAVLKSLREGLTLSRAMQLSGAFPAVLIASVKASERTSTLVSALDDYLRYDELLERLRKQAVSAAIYPSVVVGLGALITLFLLLYVIPRFSRMYADLQGSVSFATQAMLALSHMLNEHLVWVIAGLLLSLGAVVWAWRAGWIRRGGLYLLGRIEPLQRQWDHFRLAKLYQSLALMFKGGYTLDEALAVSATLGLGERLQQGLALARHQLQQGGAVSRAFSDGQLCDAVAERLLAVGERTGGFDKILQTIADRHAAAFALFIERATRIVEPLLLLLVALMVGGIVVLMYMPVFDIASTIQ